MCFYNDCVTEFAGTQVVRARKAHRCEECRGVIAPGERYEYATGKSDGSFYAVKTCRRCCYDRNRVVQHELDEGCHWDESWPPFGELVGYLRESELGQTRPEDVPAAFQVGDMPRMAVAES